MVTDIDELNERMTDATATFTRDEVRALLDWHIRHELQSDYQTQRVASVMQQSVLATEQVNASMAQLLSLWERGETSPTLEVVE